MLHGTLWSFLSPKIHFAYPWYAHTWLRFPSCKASASVYVFTSKQYESFPLVPARWYFPWPLPLPVTPPHVDVPLSAQDNKKPHLKAPRGSFNLNTRWMSALSLTSCLCQCVALNLVCCHVWRDDDSLVSCFLFGVVTKVRTFLFLNIFFFFIGGWYCVEIAHQTTRCVSEKPLRNLHYLGNAVPPSKP